MEVERSILHGNITVLFGIKRRKGIEEQPSSLPASRPPVQYDQLPYVPATMFSASRWTIAHKSGTPNKFFLKILLATRHGV